MIAVIKTQTGCVLRPNAVLLKRMSLFLGKKNTLCFGHSLNLYEMPLGKSVAEESYLTFVSH